MYDNIEFVICAAGECTRNLPHANSFIHKALLPMGDMRIIDYVLQDIIRMGGRHITFVCSNKQAIKNFQKSLGLNEDVAQKLRQKGHPQIADIVTQTLLPKDTDLKFVIQKEPLGTAHVLYVARKAIQNRHVVIIFPDDIIISKDPHTPHIKRLVDAFLKDPNTALLTGLWRDDVRNNAILVNGRIVEKPKKATTHIAGMSPNVLPQKLIQALVSNAPKKIKQIRRNHKEWFYTDVINDFLDNGGEKQGFQVKMFLKADEDQMLDTGNLARYEQCQLEMLLKHSCYQKQNRTLARKLLK